MIVETQEKKRSTKFQGENLDNFFKMKLITRLCLQLFKYSKTNQFLQSWGIRKDKVTLLSKQIETNGIEIHVSYKSTLGGKNLNLKAKITEFDQNLMLFLSIPYWSNFNDTYLPYSDSGYLQYQQRAVQFSGQCVFYFLFFKIHRYSDCFLLL